MTDALLPLFPLPSVVLFPGVLLPLHIFEPRYRSMVADALEGDRRIGMVLLRPGWEPDYDGRPPVYGVGCSAVIVHAAKLDDGRYNIVIRGLDRFRILSEEQGRAYRRAATVPWPDAPAGGAVLPGLHELRLTVASRLGVVMDASGEGDETAAAQLSAMSDADFVHTIAQYLDLEPVEKQALLECPTVEDRASLLVDFLEMKRLAGPSVQAPKQSH